MKITMAHAARDLAKVMAREGGGEAKVKTKQKVSVKVKMRKAFGKFDDSERDRSASGLTA